MNSRISVFASVILLALAVFGVQSVAAHARLQRSSPANKAQLETAPPRIELWFNELLDDNFTSVTVFPAVEVRSKQPTDYAAGKPLVDAKDRTRLLVELKPLPPGDYFVDWRVLSRDGHTSVGRFSFRVLERK